MMQTFKEPLQDKASRVQPGQEGEGGRRAVEEAGVSPGQVLQWGGWGQFGGWKSQSLITLALERMGGEEMETNMYRRLWGIRL